MVYSWLFFSPATEKILTQMSALYYTLLDKRAYFLVRISFASVQYELHFLRDKIFDSDRLRRPVIGQTNIRIHYNI